MHISKEQQEEIRKPSSVINAKKQREKIEWERLDISSRKLDTKGIFHANMDAIKEQKWYGPNSRKDIKKRWQEYIELYKRYS